MGHTGVKLIFGPARKRVSPEGHMDMRLDLLLVQERAMCAPTIIEERFSSVAIELQDAVKSGS